MMPSTRFKSPQFRPRSCTSELQLKVNCGLKVNLRIKFGLAWPGRPAQFFPQFTFSLQFTCTWSGPNISIFCDHKWHVHDLALRMCMCLSKVELISTPTHIFKLFPANICIFKFFIIMILAVKMCLDNTCGLLNIL
jgi:hypothetical protein